MAHHFLDQSKGEIISSYHYEASIAYLHCIAKHFNSTDWVTINNLYLQLLQNNPNPFIELNYAIALYYSGERSKANTILNSLQQNSFLNHYYLLNATLGKVNLLEGNYKKAKDFFLKTLEQTNFEVEKIFIQKMIDKTETKEKQQKI